MSGTIQLNLAHGILKFPVFLPDATKAVVRSLDTNDLQNCGVTAVMMNTFHIMQNPGSSTIKNAGGLHSFSNWNLPIMTDSGGFQIYSLIHQNSKKGQIRDKGARFYGEDGRQYNLTPEKSIQLQFTYQSDIVVCLDDCTHVDGSLHEQEESVRRTIAWAKRCKSEYKKLVSDKEGVIPKIFAVVQGGGYLNLRKECADALLEIGFDGYGYGGWPLDKQSNLLKEILAYTRECIPKNLPMHALGVGHPLSIRDCHKLGYDMFDSAMPTRDARHGRLYLIHSSDIFDDDQWFEFFYIVDKINIKNSKPISENCNCYCCQNFSVSYLHHLYKINDTLYYRLASIHNLYMISQLIDILGRSKENEKRIGGSN